MSAGAWDVLQTAMGLAGVFCVARLVETLLPASALAQSVPKLTLPAAWQLPSSSMGRVTHRTH